MGRHILILGGTTEARELAARLAAVPGIAVTTSLAGRTEQPVLPEGAVRIGGFGGQQGLVRWIEAHRVDLIVDATHPFAARISANASAAARQAGIARVALERPVWTPREGDRWIDATTMEGAARLLGTGPRRVFLAVGRQDLKPFAAWPMHSYVVRSVEPIPAGMLPGAVSVLARGPFDQAAEKGLLETHDIEIVVAKNSGGAATYGKIAAARTLGLPVVMVGRPASPDPVAVHSVEDAVAAVHQALVRLEERGA